MAHRVGIIGLGTVGSRFVEQFNLHDAFDLISAWDIDHEACSSHRDFVRIASSPDELIAECDLVYVAVPPLHHQQYVLDCLSHNTAIFCEKPLGVDLQSSRELVAAVNQSGLPAGVNFVFSSAPSAVELQKRLANRDLGDLIGADLRLHFSKWPRGWHEKAQWLRLRDQGGWVREVVSHFIFLTSRILGEVTLENSYIDYEDGADGSLCEQTALAFFSSRSIPLTLAGTSRGHGPDVVDLTFRGTSGSLRVWDWYQLQAATADSWVDLFSSNRDQLGADAYSAQLHQLDRMMNREEHTIATFDEALSVQESVEALLSG
ncbi:MAG: Gfo/Idh/MocA family oxidoreductase [Acidimicrobiales bacterium]|nr:Gfo/Idh/MocA family oxidoreductase [Acidimicrobiales bacterium]MDP6901454.1 Gfo/Idh/MocA family oxidoreductase [Acidimicrobiales bacterium]HJM00348.1 Gfo/Idh/MocA family oxidoreductase [Acidimicrobiales bacterium]